MKRSVVVEFVGLPGAGKSVLAHAVAGDLRRRDVPADVPSAGVDPSVPGPVRIARKLRLAAGETIARPSRSARAIAGIFKGVSRSGGGTIARSLQWLSTAGLLAHARSRPGVHLFEEGALQALWSVGIRGDVVSMLEQKDRLSPSADLIVVVDAPTSVLEQRLGSRNSRHSRVQERTGARRLEELDRGSQLLERLVAWHADTSTSGVLIRVLNVTERHRDQAVDEIVAQIRRISEV